MHVKIIVSPLNQSAGETNEDTATGHVLAVTSVDDGNGSVVPSKPENVTLDCVSCSRKVSSSHLAYKRQFSRVNRLQALAVRFFLSPEQPVLTLEYRRTASIAMHGSYRSLEECETIRGRYS